LQDLGVDGRTVLKRILNKLVSSESLGPEIGTSSIERAQLSRFHLKTETESSLRNVVFLNKNRTMDNVQKHNVCLK
jgi:hypothetical protein